MVISKRYLPYYNSLRVLRQIMHIWTGQMCQGRNMSMLGSSRLYIFGRCNLYFIYKYIFWIFQWKSDGTGIDMIIQKKKMERSVSTFIKRLSLLKYFLFYSWLIVFFSGLKIGIFTTQQRLKNFGLHNKQNLKKPAETYIMKRDKDTKHEISNI